LLGLSRSSFYYQDNDDFESDLKVKALIDAEFTARPFYGSRRMAVVMSQALGADVNRKRIQRLMREMGIQAIYPKPNLSKRDDSHKIYPYLLRDVKIVRPNQVWSTDITYVPLSHGFAYLVAVIDWYSRYVLSWSLSNSMETSFCIRALDQALEVSIPEIFNSDQGSQFTSIDFTARLIKKNISISMDGRGRALDNIFVERLWRSVKYEDIYPRGYEGILEAEVGLKNYFQFYNKQRPHQSLKYRTPYEVYHMN
jgi:putative transposase